MFERTINGVMLMAVVGATTAIMATAALVGHGQWPRAAAASRAARVETAASIETPEHEMALRETAVRAPVSADSCDERPARRRPRAPEGCVDPTAALAPR
jgi:hypothetical protein